MKEMNLAWNTYYSAKEANSTNSCEKQPYKYQFRTDSEYLYEDIDRHIREQDVEPTFTGPPKLSYEDELASDPVLAGAASLINACLRAKFLKFTTQILKWNDFPSKVGAKKGRGKTILKTQPTLAHSQVFYIDFCNQLPVESQKGKKCESNQVLLLDQVSIIIKSLR